jgi:hypothetical protein
MDTLLRHKKKVAAEMVKSNPASQGEHNFNRDDLLAKEAVQATEDSAQETVEEVLDKAVEESTVEIPNSTEPSEASVYEKYRKAFGLDQFDIKL